MQLRPLFVVLPLTMCLACQARRPLGHSEDPALGRVDEVQGTCTPEEEALVQDVFRWSRVVAISGAFEQCLSRGWTHGTTFHEGHPNNPMQILSHRVGPYVHCAEDPLPGAPAAEQLQALLRAARSPNDTTFECHPDDDRGAGWVNIEDTNVDDPLDIERIHFGRALSEAAQVLDAPPCTQAQIDSDPDFDFVAAGCRRQLDPWPHGGLAKTTIHEISHTHGYLHGGGVHDCRYPSGTPSGAFVSAPYMLGSCALLVAVRSHNACGSVESCPDGSSLRLITDIDDQTGESCACLADPRGRTFERAELEVEYLSPRTDHTRVLLNTSGVATIAGVRGESQQVRLRLHKSIPGPLSVHWLRTSAGGGVLAKSGRTVEYSISDGDTIEFTALTSGTFVPGTVPSSVSYTVQVVGQIDLPTANPERPYDLSQSIAIRNTSGQTPEELGVAVQSYDPDTGYNQLPLTFEARSPCYSGWTYPCDIEFIARGPLTTRWSDTWGPDQRAVWAPSFLYPGDYVWSARSLHQGRSSAEASLPVGFNQSHFLAHGPLLWSDPVPPHRPVDMSHGLAWDDDLVLLTATAWDMNGTDVTFEFEVRPIDQSLRDLPTHTFATTAPSHPGPSLRATAAINLPWDTHRVYHWQVRAISGGEASDWVPGGSYPDRDDLLLARLERWNREPPIDYLVSLLGLPDLPQQPDFQVYPYERYTRGLHGHFHVRDPRVRLEQLEVVELSADVRLLVGTAGAITGADPALWRLTEPVAPEL